MEEWVEKKKEEGLENLLAMAENKKNTTVDKISGLGW